MNSATDSTTTTLACPKCRGTMVSYERNGITVEQCGDCRGVFLDRGELERLIAAQEGEVAGGGYDREQGLAGFGGHHGAGHHGGRYGRKRRGFLGELFD